MRRTIRWAVFLAVAAGASAQAPTDAKALLASGAALIDSKPAEAVRLLQQALRLDPELPTLRYQLGLAYHAIGDEADAEAELREAVSHAPDSAAAHNYLGIVRFQLGDAKAALEEFRAAEKLSPNDPNAHFNLGEALARTGDSAGAVAELRLATGLAPRDAGLARLLETVETKVASPEGAIKVDVRQVLVPVVVTDAQGHHVTGLTQEDFKVFEDGVEQKISGFSVESAGLPDLGGGAPAGASPVSPVAAPVPRTASAAVKPRRTYMILIDTLHTSLPHFTAAREALAKMFREEHSADTQYVAVALGVSPQMVINVTRDASAVLAVLESKRMQKIFLDGQMGGIQPEMDQFRSELSEARYACDMAAKDTVLEIKCAAGLSRATEQSRQISELDRAVTADFLRQFRSLVAQLARARDRRTIVLISDGFGIEPGKEAFALLNAFFPFASHCFVPQSVYCPPNQTLAAGRMDEFESILMLAAAGNVTIDTIDSRGLYGQQAYDAAVSGTSPTVDGAVGRVERDNAAAHGNTLAEVAAATGGTAFHDSNNLLNGLERAFADGRNYYTVAYVPANANYDGKFRAITVQVRDAKSVVNAKRGYWATPSGQ